MTWKMKREKKSPDFVISDPSSFQKCNNTPPTTLLSPSCSDILLTDTSTNATNEEISEDTFSSVGGRDREDSVSFGEGTKGEGGDSTHDALVEALRLGGRRDMLVSRGESVFDVSGIRREKALEKQREKKTFPEEKEKSRTTMAKKALAEIIR